MPETAACGNMDQPPEKEGSSSKRPASPSPPPSPPHDEQSNQLPPVPPETPVDFMPGITHGDLATAIRVLDAVAKLNPKKQKKVKMDKEHLAGDGVAPPSPTDMFESYKSLALRPFRKALAGCMDIQRMCMFDGKSEADHYEERQLKRSLKRQKMAERDFQKKYIAETQLRKGRVDKLREKQTEAEDEERAKIMRFMIPDGHVETGARMLENGTTEGEGDLQDQSDDAVADGSAEPGIKLPKLRSCYVCKVRYRDLHHFYDQLCPSCAALNWEKRHQSADLRGRVAVVTGSRVKIGYQTCLKLLRAGATVVATTRFPNAAADTYRQEPDFDAWKDRLQVYGLDLRDVTGLEAFARFVKMRFSESGIDILVNNACQTVRRPTAYYLPITQVEQKLWQKADDTHKKLLGGCVEFERVRRKLVMDQKMTYHAQDAMPQLQAATSVPMLGCATDDSDKMDSKSEFEPTAMVMTVDDIDDRTRSFEKTGLSHSAAMSQMVLLPEDAGVSDSVLPPGVTDINGQQLDLRKTNSWLLKMEQVSTPEVLECMFINAIAPFVLNSRLKPLMAIPADDSQRPDRYIINVSAMEGKFYRYKMANHPHTNMAKAALNMMTRTSAEDLAKKHRIFMNSVDTGWINDENPLEKANQTAKVNLFQTPIDEVDAAARILDPIFVGVNSEKDESASEETKEKDYGKFLKDYRETEW